MWYGAGGTSGGGVLSAPGGVWTPPGEPAPSGVFAPVLDQGCEAELGPCGHGEINVPKRRRDPGRNDTQHMQ